VPNVDGQSWDVLQIYFKEYYGPTALRGDLAAASERNSACRMVTSSICQAERLASMANIKSPRRRGKPGAWTVMYDLSGYSGGHLFVFDPSAMDSGKADPGDPAPNQATRGAIRVTWATLTGPRASG